jgi:hypothetical protein
VLDREGKIFARLGSARQLEARLKEALNARRSLTGARF